MSKKQLQDQGLKEVATTSVMLRNKTRASMASMNIGRGCVEGPVDVPKDFFNASSLGEAVMQTVPEESLHGAMQMPGAHKYRSSVLIENFSENSERLKNSECTNLMSVGETKLSQRSKKGMQQEVQKFKRKLSRIEDELKKIKKKRIVFNEKEKLLKSKRIKVVSKIKQREIPLEYFEELHESQKEVEPYLIAEEDFMEQMAIEKLVELSRKANKY
ncbi:uncharacterized protein VICG_01914 [Vittaforma corneae ATCC 50505]|uniref:Uncharacterized protein n=1 Tax=Vittaforma corneae (strain ATCC 50505) TaxID=993615 RepID=L2GL53_VITCO|nr:uncharacterized protein VICG_01914 [Vittaforma corneae ATCC 50505]ELA41032.1 hypothetical protein VICG_01914 [Vittaforma corneae ATCC 50505]